MLPFPYKADVELSRWPVLTLLVCAVCIGVFARQVSSAHAYATTLNQYCTQNIAREERLVLRYLSGPPGQHYCDVLLEIRAAPDHAVAIRDLAENSRPTPFYRNRADSVDYVYTTLSASFARFERGVPNSLTDRLHFDPNRPTLVSMVTAAFTHADWWHLASNLIFFFAFAASVEVIIGSLYFAGFIVLSAIGTHWAYSYSVAGIESAAPTVGLSGVVMAMMAFLATVMPTLRIRCFFWFLIIVRTFRVPALAIAAFYIFENLVDYLHRDPASHINYVAHISGAILGVVAGFLYRGSHRQFLLELRQVI